MSQKFRLGIDIGGTFTDGVLIDETTGELKIDKVLTTPKDPSEGFLNITQRITSHTELSPDIFRYVIHATTIATNALLERRGARAGLLVTQGFRDVLEIGRQIRHELYNLQTEKVAPLIPRNRCFEIPERINYQGDVLLPLDEAAIVEAVAKLRAEEVESIAICFLHSYRNPAHEKRTAEIVQAHWPEVNISMSSDVAPEIREYWRASTAATNAYIAPTVRRYMDKIEQKLLSEGFDKSIYIMQSNGGITTSQMAKKHPIHIIESGPAAGVAAAAHISKLVGYADAISFDMGGTTAKMGLIRDNQPNVLAEFEAGSHAGSGSGLVRGSGYPILTSVMDLVEVGAGGGSLAWIDSGGLMRVGPKSAGADPGPVCYGRGGTQPAITDANVVLGRLNPDYFLGGQLTLDKQAAYEAIETHCAQPLGLSVTEAASGIVDIAIITMVQAMRLVSVQRGYDPRDFCLVGFGGAGPIHANQLAIELGIPTVIIPPSPGVASALGMLVSNLRHDYRVTRIQPLAEVDFDDLATVWQDFTEQGLSTLQDEGLRPEEMVFTRYLDMRYIGQSWKLSIPLPEGELGASITAAMKKAFDQQHEQIYGFSVPEEGVEIVNVGLSAVGLVEKPKLREVPQATGAAESARKGLRAVYFPETGGFVECPIYDRYALQQGHIFPGPAIVEEMDSTVVVHPGYNAHVEAFGILVLHKVEA